jgi:exopolyphosphatase/guanosine-5'-triphosphate,3'-diphosphate pyrophosphatase
LFDQTAALHGLGPAERGLLEVAGLLHDVGYDVSQSAHHKHSLYLIRNADLDGFTSRERDLIANVARYHRKALPADRHAEYMALDDADRTLVRRLAALLRLADGLDADHFQVVEAATVVDQGNLIRLELTTRSSGCSKLPKQLGQVRQMVAVIAPPSPPRVAARWPGRRPGWGRLGSRPAGRGRSWR